MRHNKLSTNQIKTIFFHNHKIYGHHVLIYRDNLQILERISECLPSIKESINTKGYECHYVIVTYVVTQRL